MANVKKVTIAAGIIAGAIVILGISPYFYNTEVNEELPSVMENSDVQQMTVASGTFVGVGDGIHDASGDAKILSSDGTKFLRLENFQSTNGPDLYVYLATDTEASDFVNLGRLKANMGNQNYEVPSDVDLSKYNQVLIWCQAFSVLFGNAELS